MMASVAMVMRTNVPGQSIPNDFLSKITEYLAKLFGTEAKMITLEIQTDTLMMRAASTAPMMNVDLHHNSNKVTQAEKPKFATSIAQYISTNAHLPEDRILVLFFDTRKCT